jgi:hypothetical protein
MSPMAWTVRTAWSQSTRSTTTTACRACLFYHDLDANGRLIFNVKDFNDAYVGPFTWGLKRFAASVALIGYAKALGDEQIWWRCTRARTASGSTPWPPAPRATRCRPSPWTPAQGPTRLRVRRRGRCRYRRWWGASAHQAA